MFASKIDDSHSREVVRTIFVRFIENERPTISPDGYPPMEIGGTVHRTYARRKVILWDEDAATVQHPTELSPDIESEENIQERRKGMLSKVRKLARRLKFPYARQGEHVRSLAFHKERDQWNQPTDDDGAASFAAHVGASVGSLVGNKKPLSPAPVAEKWEINE